jgi:hypothetical protein
MPKVTITAKDGKIFVDVEGVQGPACSKVPELLRKLSQIPPRDTREDDKPEFFHTESAQEPIG